MNCPKNPTDLKPEDTLCTKRTKSEKAKTKAEAKAKATHSKTTYFGIIWVTESYAGAYSVLFLSLDFIIRLNFEEVFERQPEHPPEDDDEPEHEGAAGDDEDHQHIVLD